MVAPSSGWWLTASVTWPVIWARAEQAKLSRNIETAEKFRHMLREDITFDVDTISGSAGVEVRGGPGVGDNGYFDETVFDGGDGQADAVNSDRAFIDEVGIEVLGDSDS